ncbi:hypothetical protein RI129_008414 [Pyrocoelia pectoralis]|uniref:Uncharacterized protein n=1 Tax=Pyrocoelia pectoralis TaxID=417401 RepID=A0AAN7ZHE7_9COLE
MNMILYKYKLDLSPPTMSVQMMLKALDVRCEEKDVDIFDKEYMNKEFIKINPQRSIPTLIDDGHILWDSHAILIYLVKKFGKEEEYYPSEPLKRAVIDQRLYFESCNIFGLLRLIARPIVYHQYKGVSDYNIYECNDTYERLNLFLEKTKWVAGDDITVADFSLIPSVTSLDSFVPIDSTKYPNILKWIDRAKEWPFYDINQRGVDDFTKLVNRFCA